MNINQCLAAGKEGVDIPIEHYHNLDGISGTSLTFLEESNAHYENRAIFWHDSEALTFGNLVHTLCLEPEKMPNLYAIAPVFDGRTKEGKAAREEWLQRSSGKTSIALDDFEIASRMATHVEAIAGHIISAGIRERSFFAEPDGMVIKARPDILTPQGDDYDLKTISLRNGDFSDYALEQVIRGYHYHQSAGFRNIVRRSLGHTIGDSFLIFVSKGAGHMVKIRQIDPEWVAEGEAQVMELLKIRKDYLAYGWDTEPRIIDRRNRAYNN